MSTMRHGVWCAALWAALLAVGGCSNATQVIVLIDAEPGIRADADALDVTVEGRNSRTGVGVVKLEESMQLGADQTWPIRVAMRPQDDDPTRVFALEVNAQDGNTTIASARIVSSYVEGEVRYALVLLEDACRGQVCTGTDETCRAGDCVAAFVEPGKLSKSADDAIEPPMSDAGSDADTSSDAAIDADTSSDAAIDADTSSDAAIDAATDAGRDAATDAGSDAAIDGGCGMPEQCNGLDDDCDEEIDEDLVRACGTDVGACSRGEQQCVDSSWTTCDGTSPGTEGNSCDAIDSDCDGKTDEGLGCLLYNQRTSLDIETDLIFDLTTNTAGDIFATGYTCDDYSSESCDLWVGRFDNTGVQGWVRRYDGGYAGYQYFVPDVGRGIALDRTGNVVVFGTLCNGGTEESCNLWLRKLTAGGDPVTGWNIDIDVGGAMMGNDQAADVVVAADGSVYIAATVSTNYDPTDTWIRKYNASGAVVWTEVYNSPGSYTDGVNALSIDGNGDLLVAGFTNNNQAWLRKYAPDRTVRWTRTHSSPSVMNPYARATGVAVDSDDNVYVIGEYDSAVATTWVRKYDVDGNLIDTLDIPVYSNALAGPTLTVDREDNVVIALSFYGGSTRGRDMRVDKYDSALAPMWSYVYDNAGADDYANAVTTDAQSNVILGGCAEATADTNTLDTWIRIYGP